MKKFFYIKNIRYLAFIIMSIYCILFYKTTFYAEENSTQNNEADYKLYAMNDWAKEFISIPESYPVSFQIPISAASDISYRVISGDSVEVSDAGLVTPKIVTWYYIDYGNYSVGTTVPEEGVEYSKITNKVEYGISTIQVIENGETFEITVEVCDYATVYADEVIDTYIKEKFTDSMSVEKKLDMICRFPASYNYSDEYSGYSGMIVSGGGDCWASTSLILEVCERLGVEAKARNGNRDFGAGSGHINVLVIIGEGDYYELDAGYVGEAPRGYSVEHRTSLFSYRNVTDGIEVYQYDGDIADMSTLVVPETIDSKTVVAIGEKFISLEGVKEVVLPNTITTIKKSAFNSCGNLQTLHIPASVTNIGDLVFTNCKSLTNLTCSEDNSVYATKDSILYDKNYTKVFFAPTCTNVELPVQTDTIGDYAFYYNRNVTEFVLSENIKILQEGAFSSCFNLEKAELKAVEKIGSYAFAMCSELKKVTLKAVEEIGSYAFADNNTSEAVFFEGNAPIFGENVFYNTTTTVYYPIGDDTWTEAIMQNYGGMITWVSYDPNITMGDVSGDKEVKINDMLMILHGISGSQILDENQQIAADIDKDGEVTVRDMLRVMHYISGASSAL